MHHWIVVLICVICVTVEAVEEREAIEWRSFKEKHGKSYSGNVEDAQKRDVWAFNKRVVQALAASSNDLATYGDTKFSDITQAEFAQKFLRLSQPPTAPRAAKNVVATVYEASKKDLETFPGIVDWRTHDPPVMTPIIDQGICGSCWAVSTVSCLETAAAISGRELKRLSSQQLVDCSREYGNLGCDGGWMDYAFDYMLEHAVDADDAYPYTGEERAACRDRAGGVQLGSYSNVAGRNERAMLTAVQRGPLAVAVNAVKFQFYVSGIMTGAGCSPADAALNHAVVVVGYNNTNVPPFWIVRNSWGDSWGEAGYCRMRMGGNTCGISNYPSVASA